MLQHIECPRCNAPNLSSDYCCFACGTRLKALPKRLGGQPTPAPPWPIWIGGVLLLGLAGFLIYLAVLWLVNHQATQSLPLWYLPVAGLGLLLAAQLAFWEARRRDANSWHLKRAPELSLLQSHTGDAVWARGKVFSESPIVPAYFPQECIYFHYVVREREPGKSGWQVRERMTNAVDFELLADGKRLYVPSGCVRFDAPLYVETYLDPDASIEVKLWAIPVNLPVSLCGRIAGETTQPRIDPLEPYLPGVVTWRAPADYVAMVARQAKAINLGGWLLTVLGVIALIAGIVKTVG